MVLSTRFIVPPCMNFFDSIEANLSCSRLTKRPGTNKTNPPGMYTPT
jgi:hypothetical protein